ncbi:MAG: hypothetical protein Q8P38_04975 [Candidatus Nanopelagicales bacterium]|nr:hypothetical protein [Candidatus Nanopelagicales bacterium]
MEGKIDMAARRQMTNKLRTQYRTASRAERGEILDRVVDTTGMGRSTARRMLTGPRLVNPAEQVDGRTLRPRAYGDDVASKASSAGVNGRPRPERKAETVTVSTRQES